MNNTTPSPVLKVRELYANGWPATLAQVFLHTVEKFPSGVASRTAGKNDVKTWAETYIEVEQLALSLTQLGVQKADTVAVMLKNRPEFLTADLAVMCLGAIPFSLYATLPTAQIVPQLDNADAKIIICEQDFLPRILDAQQAYPNLEHIILLEGNDTRCIDWSSLFIDAGDFNLKEIISQIEPSDIGTIIYTSGTTGAAKGVELTQGGLVALARTNNLFLDLYCGGSFISWLPFAGMAERAVSYHLGLLSGGTIVFCDDPQNVVSVLPDVNPNLFFAPPRLWEKIKDLIDQRWSTFPEEEQAQIHQAVARNIERVELEQRGEVLPEALANECIEDDRRWFKPMRVSLGLGRDDICVVSGGAGASPELLKFYYAIGLPLDEVYGQTESCGLGTRNPKGAMKIGTVGKPQEGIEFKFAEDNEILLRSPAIMCQYRKQPEKTAEAIDPEGWLHTGDIGEMDADGYVKIVDRKKDMIINSFGKNMSPVNIEASLTDAGPFIAQAVCIGEARRYNTAVLTLNSEYVLGWAKQNGIADNFDSLITNPRLIAEVEKEVMRGNESLARVEQIKKFVIVGKEWVSGDDEITPTLKLKRKLIAERYASQIDALYS